MVLPIIPGTLKAITSNLARTFAGSLRAKGHKNFGDKGAWAYPGTAQFFCVPPISSGTFKAMTSNLAGTFAGSIRAKGR